MYVCDLCDSETQLSWWPSVDEFFYRPKRLSRGRKEFKEAEHIKVGFDPARKSERYTGLYYILCENSQPLTYDDVLWVQQHTTPLELFGHYISPDEFDTHDEDDVALWHNLCEIYSDWPTDPESEEGIAKREWYYGLRDSTSPFSSEADSVLSVYGIDGHGRYPVHSNKGQIRELALDIAYSELNLIEFTNAHGDSAYYGLVTEYDTTNCTCEVDRDELAVDPLHCSAVYDDNMTAGVSTIAYAQEPTRSQKHPCGTVITHKRVKPDTDTYLRELSSIVEEHQSTVVSALERLSKRLSVNEGKRSLVVVENVYPTAVAATDTAEMEKRRDETIKLMALRQGVPLDQVEYTHTALEMESAPVGQWELYTVIKDRSYLIVTAPYATKIILSDKGYKPKAGGRL
ncbi:MAG: hypothetical protein GY833_12925 [Aestuariibacter sp.]|nr:hypothetical protein [Aestuariibacter sp.]